MSLMCKISKQGCATRGMCIHEKMMGVVVLMALGAAGHFWLHLF